MKEIILVSSGTIQVGVGVSSVTSNAIQEPTRRYPKFAIAFNNASGVTIGNVTMSAQNVNIGSKTGLAVQVSAVQPQNGASGANDTVLVNIETNAYPFLFGTAEITFDFSTATSASGTIDWSLYAY